MEGDCRGQVEGVTPAFCLDELRNTRKTSVRLIGVAVISTSVNCSEDYGKFHPRTGHEVPEGE